MDAPAIKICGLMKAQDVLLCCRLGVDIISFITEYPSPAPWDLTKDQTARLMENVTGNTKTCVITGGSRDKVISLGRKLRPDYIQLHGHENLADASVIAKTLAPEGIKIIKPIPTEPMERMIQFATMDPARCARLLNETQVYAILVSSRIAGKIAKNQGFVNMDFYHQIKEASTLPVILGGGITPDNCQDIIKNTAPDIVDVMSGVEIRPGVKDSYKLETLIKNIRE